MEKLDVGFVYLKGNGVKCQRDRVSRCVERTQKRLKVVDLETRDTRHESEENSIPARDEARSGQERAKGIANLIESSLSAVASSFQGRRGTLLPDAHPICGCT